ncbi:MAG: DUF3727 domain-containing protein [Cyanobium sp.]
MPPESPATTGSGDVPTLLVNDTQGRQLLCYLEQLVPLDGHDYALLTPVDTPVSLVRLPRSEEEEPEEILDWDVRTPILDVAEAVLQEHNLTLVRSAATLTVTGDFDDDDLDDEDEDAEPDEEEELEDEDGLEDDEEGGDLFESLLDRPFFVGEEQYDLFVPLDPFFVVARVEGNLATLVEGEEFERIQPRLEAELEERDLET